MIRANNTMCGGCTSPSSPSTAVRETPRQCYGEQVAARSAPPPPLAAAKEPLKCQYFIQTTPSHYDESVDTCHPASEARTEGADAPFSPPFCASRARARVPPLHSTHRRVSASVWGINGIIKSGADGQMRRLAQTDRKVRQEEAEMQCFQLSSLKDGREPIASQTIREPRRERERAAEDPGTIS
jgi:hypothetical protein